MNSAQNPAGTDVLVAGEFSIPPDHPALAGHFPGDPIVPGVSVLQRVLLALASALPELAVTVLTDVKFLNPLRPNDLCRFRIRRVDSARLRFECRVADRSIARGTFRVDFEL